MMQNNQQNIVNQLVGGPEGEQQPPPNEGEPPDNLKKYIRMIKMGVPVPAVKLKMKAEGEDPDSIDKFLDDN